MENQSESPSYKQPKPEIEEAPLSFPKAIEQVIYSKKITKLEWKNDQIYGFLKDGLLMLHKEDKTYTWIVSEADMIGEDWIVISE